MHLVSLDPEPTSPTARNRRIVEQLEKLLAKAKAGEMTGLFVFYESDTGEVEHLRDGMPDNAIIFALELIKRRIMGMYR